MSQRLAGVSDAEATGLANEIICDMINRLNDSFWTELESIEYNRKQGDAVDGRTVEQIEDYAGRFAATGRAERARARGRRRMRWRV
jgi:hypothetical protein